MLASTMENTGGYASYVTVTCRIRRILPLDFVYVPESLNVWRDSGGPGPLSVGLVGFNVLPRAQRNATHRSTHRTARNTRHISTSPHVRPRRTAEVAACPAANTPLGVEHRERVERGAKR